MPVVNPLPKEKAAPELQEAYEAMHKKFGKMPNFFGAMAHRPAVLQKFLPLYGEIVSQGTVDARYKELAYLKTAMVNGCEY
jgi:alkylhydroperoxidase/carboxymuconolactone decarboxylase family protein YurZ